MTAACTSLFFGLVLKDHAAIQRERAALGGRRGILVLFNSFSVSEYAYLSTVVFGASRGGGVLERLPSGPASASSGGASPLLGLIAEYAGVRRGARWARVQKAAGLLGLQEEPRGVVRGGVGGAVAGWCVLS